MEAIAPFKILFLEDSMPDIVLMKRILDSHAFKYKSMEVSLREDFLNALKTFKPDIILADYSLPTFNGMHAFQLLKKQKNYIAFILVTGVLSGQMASECLCEGIDDFLIKSDFKNLPAVIARNLEIKKAERIRDSIEESLEMRDREIRKLRGIVEKEKLERLLSKREFEILCQIASGKAIKEIAAQLNLSPPTVATYRSRLLEKMNFRSNVEIANYATRNGLIE